MSKNKKNVEELLAKLNTLPMDSKEHEQLILEILETPYGRDLLAAAMVPTIVRAISGSSTLGTGVQSEPIPVPNDRDTLDMVLAVVAKNDAESNRYYDGETSSDAYMATCAKQMSEITWIVTLNKSCDSTLIEFWTKHRNFSEWGLITQRSGGYQFLPTT